MIHRYGYAGLSITGSAEFILSKIRERHPAATEDAIMQHFQQHSVVVPRQGFRLDKLVEGAKAVVDTALRPVPDDLALKRGKVCEDCSMRVTATSECWSCYMGDAVFGVLQALRPPMHDSGRLNEYEQLGCAVCDCSIKILIRSPRNAIPSSTLNAEGRPDECWMKSKTLL